MGQPEKSIVLDITKYLPETSSISVVGSSTRGYVSRPSDLDFLITTHSHLSVSHERCIGALHELMKSRHGGTWIASDDAMQLSLDDGSISIVFADDGILNGKLNGLLTGVSFAPEYKIWTMLGCAPEVLAADIMDCDPILDKYNILAGWSTKLESYPRVLRKNIIDATSAELSIKMSMLEQARLSNDETILGCMPGSIVFPLLRLMFASEEIYFRGMKHVTKQIEYYIPHRLELVRKVAAMNFECDLEAISSEIAAVVSQATSSS